MMGETPPPQTLVTIVSLALPAQVASAHYPDPHRPSFMGDGNADCDWWELLLCLAVLVCVCGGGSGLRMNRCILILFIFSSTFLNRSSLFSSLSLKRCDEPVGKKPDITQTLGGFPLCLTCVYMVRLEMNRRSTPDPLTPVRVKQNEIRKERERWREANVQEIGKTYDIHPFASPNSKETHSTHLS